MRLSISDMLLILAVVVVGVLSNIQKFERKFYSPNVVNSTDLIRSGHWPYRQSVKYGFPLVCRTVIVDPVIDGGPEIPVRYRESSLHVWGIVGNVVAWFAAVVIYVTAKRFFPIFRARRIR